MPIYTYKCKDESCGHVEEDVLILSVTKEESERPTCSECAGEMEKCIGESSYLIHYKGDGFYQTDQNNKNYQ